MTKLNRDNHFKQAIKTFDHNTPFVTVQLDSCLLHQSAFQYVSRTISLTNYFNEQSVKSGAQWKA